MNNSNVSLDIVFNVTGEQGINKANSALNTTKKNLDSGTKSSRGFGSAIGKLTIGLGALGLAAQALGVLKDVLVEPIKDSIRLNAEYENLSNSIASLISINHENIDSMGNVLSVQEKHAKSLSLAKETIDDLKNVGIELGYSMNDMSDMFKGFYSTAGATMSLEQAKEVMEKIAVAANVSGVDVESLKVTLDNLGSGVADTATDFGRFIKSLGLSTEAMTQAKNEGKLYELMLEKLSPLQESVKAQSMSYSVAVGKLNSAFDDLKRSAMSEYFEKIKNSIASMTEFITSNKDRFLAVFAAWIDHIQRIWDSLKELALFLWEEFGNALKWIASCFKESNKELDTFTILLKGMQTTMVGIVAVINVIVEGVKLVINTIKGMINKAMAAGDALKYAFSFGKDKVALASFNKRMAENDAIWEKMKGNVSNMGDVLVDSYKEILALWNDEQEKVNKDVETNTTKLVAKKRAITQTKQTKAQEKGLSETERLKAFWDYEYRIRERNISLMQDGKKKEIALEKLRYERTITNLNFEVNEKLKSGELELAQVNALYEAENKLHEKRIKEIQEYNLYVEQITTSLNYSLSSGFNELLSGKSSIADAFSNIMSEAQNSITQGFSTALSDAFTNSRVMKGMQDAFGSVFEKLMGEDGALGKLFGEGGALGGLMESAGAAIAGFSIGNSVGGIATSLLGDEGNKKIADITTKVGSGIGAAAGAAFAGPLGAVVGGAIGGLVGALGGTFYSNNTKQTGSGVELTSRATKDSINAREYADFTNTKKYMWGLIKKENHYTEHYSANEKALRAIKNTLRTYEYALKDIGGTMQTIGVDAGRYSSYAAIADAGAKEIIANFLGIPKTIEKEFTRKRIGIKRDKFGSGYIGIITETYTKTIENPDLSAVYKVWEDYAKGINKSVNEALLESLNTYINTGNNYQTWLYNFKGQESEALKFQAELAKQQVERITEGLGAENVTIDNYMQFREDMLKRSFDPETIANINALGEALMASGEATKKYEEALKGEKKTKLNMIDPFLAKTKKLEDLQNNKDDTQEKLSVQMLSTLKQILRTNQESLEMAK